MYLRWCGQQNVEIRVEELGDIVEEVEYILEGTAVTDSDATEQWCNVNLGMGVYKRKLAQCLAWVRTESHGFLTELHEIVVNSVGFD